MEILCGKKFDLFRKEIIENFAKYSNGSKTLQNHTHFEIVMFLTRCNELTKLSPE